jgi:hypothetical protein
MRLHGTMSQGEKRWSAKLGKFDVLIKIPLLILQGLSQREIGHQLGVSESAIYNAIQGKRWAHLYREPPPVFTPEIDQKYIAIRGEIVVDKWTS